MKAKAISSRSFGIEIECFIKNKAEFIRRCNAAGVEMHDEHYNHTTRSYWKVVTDASLQNCPSFHSAIEVVSPPIKGDNGLREIRIVCAILCDMKAKVNTSCGMHVHHDARDMSLNAWKTLVKRFYDSEGTIQSFLPRERRTNYYTQPIRGNFRNQESAHITINAATSINQLMSYVNPHGDRYYALNLTAFLRHGTIEFRNHSGTVEADKIIAWVLLGQAMIENSVIMTVCTYARKMDSFNGLMTIFRVMDKGDHPEIKSYFKARAAKFAGA